MRAHSLIAKARKARGVAYVRSVLASLDVEDPDALAKAIKAAVRDLDAAKRETPDTGDTGEDTGDTGETVEDTGETVETARTASDYVTALTGPTVALRELVESGDIPENLDAWLVEVARIARAAKAAKAAA